METVQYYLCRSLWNKADKEQGLDLLKEGNRKVVEILRIIRRLYNIRFEHYLSLPRSFQIYFGSPLFRVCSSLVFFIILWQWLPHVVTCFWLSVISSAGIRNLYLARYLHWHRTWIDISSFSLQKLHNVASFGLLTLMSLFRKQHQVLLS